MNILETLSQELQQLTRQAARWVVRVNGRRGPNAAGVLWSNDLVVTSLRAIHREDQVEVGLPDGTTLLARLQGQAPDFDFAILKLNNPLEGFEAPPWSDTPQPGLAVALARDRENLLLSKLGFLPGEHLVHRFSPAPEFLGSPLIDYQGHFLGLHVLQGVPTVLSYSHLQNLVESLQRGDILEPGFLGLGLHQVEHQGGQACLVIRVEPPAEVAGLKIGDIVVRIDGQSTDDPLSTRELLRTLSAGSGVKIDFFRNGEEQTTEVILSARHPGPPHHHHHPGHGLGRQIRRMVRHFKHQHHGPPPHHHHGGPPEPPGPVIC